MLLAPHQPSLVGLARSYTALSLLALSAALGRAESTNTAIAAPAGSPRLECLPLLQAWRVAESHAASIPAGDVLVGRGDSMLPLYPDCTVMVVQRQPLGELRPGMTVVFIGDSGRPVAHILVARTPRGWTAKGMANAYLDRTLVRAQNYLGTVVRAFSSRGEGTPTMANVALADAVPGAGRSRTAAE